MVLRDMNNTLQKQDSPLHAGMGRPCAFGQAYYSEFLEVSLDFRDMS